MMRCTFGALLLAISGCVDAFPDLAPVTDARGLEDSGSMDRGMDAAQAPDRALTPDVTVDAAPDVIVDAAPAPDMTQPDMNNCVPAAEACNGLDDNCNGQIDEDLPRQPCDLSMGVCAGTTVACTNGRYDDCNYALADPAYEAEESRCDALDNDCDGQTDEGCSCAPGETRPCGTGVGACEPGVMRCVDGRFDACDGAIGPQLETCNGIDDDCNGQIDEVDGPCESPLPGPCRMGTRQCVAGEEVCTPIVMPVAETCNGVDDDCDGQTDNGLDKQPCDTGLDGVCSGGQTRCDGNTIRCDRVVEPGAQDEQCNGIDDDCDGEIDNLAVQECASDLPGVCRPGQRACDDQNEAYCAPLQTPSPESCDDLDNDCDGSVDEDTGGGLCELGPACRPGRDVCRNGQLQCQPVDQVANDLTCDGVDDDCDGQIDEDASGARCQTGNAECPIGRSSCVDGESMCVPELKDNEDVGPDDIDQDCDGEVDEGTLTVYFEDLMMNGDGRRPGVNRGPVPGYANATVRQGRVFDPELSPVEIVDYVFRPLPNGLTQVTSNEFTYDFSEHVGNLQSWSPPAKGPWTYQGDRGVPPLMSPHMLELHANMGITFDLAVLTARYPDHELHQMRSRAGSSDRGSVKIMLLVDGELHDESPCMARRGDGPRLDTLSNLDGRSLRDARYITFAAVNCGAGNINNMHGLLHDARVVMRPR